MLKKRIKFLSILLTLTLAISVSCPASVKAFAESIKNSSATSKTNNPDLTIFTSNDVHGFINQCIEDNGISYANAAWLKKNTKNSLLIDAGDHIGGASYSNYDSGYHMVDFMKMCNYDMSVPGNHEFTYGINQFYDTIKHAGEPSQASANTFDYTACNFFHYNPDTQKKGDLVLPAYKNIKINDSLTVGFVGVMTPETISKTSPGFFQDQDGRYIYQIDTASETNNDIYNDFNNAINASKTDAENPANIVIGVGHLGRQVDSKNNYITSGAVISKSKGLTAFIDGHSHDMYPYINPTDPSLSDNGERIDADGNTIKAIQTGTAFYSIGKIEITKEGDKYSAQTSLMTKDMFKSNQRDSSVLEQERDWYNTINKQFEEKIGMASYPYYIGENNETIGTKRWVRKFETNLTDLVADSIYWYGNNINFSNNNNIQYADLSIVNGGSIRDAIKEGIISRLTCFNILPFISRLGIATVPGSLLREVLEFSYRNYGVIDKDTGTYLENGGLMATSGIQFTVDQNIKSGVVVDEENNWVSGPIDGNYRVKNIKIYNKQSQKYEDIQMDKNYKIAGTTYFFKGFGDGFSMFKNKDVKVDEYDLLTDKILSDYIQAFKNSQTNNLPDIVTENSPLYLYPNFQLDYENQFGAGRVGSYNIKFDSNGGSYIPEQNIFINHQAIQPKQCPTREGFTFDGWYSNKELTTKFDFNNPINSDTTIYAKWIDSNTPQQDAYDTNITAQTGDHLNYIIVSLAIFLLFSSLYLFINWKSRKTI